MDHHVKDMATAGEIRDKMFQLSFVEEAFRLEKGYGKFLQSLDFWGQKVLIVTREKHPLRKLSLFYIIGDFNAKQHF